MLQNVNATFEWVRLVDCCNIIVARLETTEASAPSRAALSTTRCEGLPLPNLASESPVNVLPCHCGASICAPIVALAIRPHICARTGVKIFTQPAADKHYIIGHVDYGSVLAQSSTLDIPDENNFLSYVVLIVPNSNGGSGFSVHAESGISELLPSILRRVADDISGQVGIS